MAKFTLVWLGLVAVLVVAAGCQTKEAGVYQGLLQTDFNLGISFGMSPSQVHNVLGEPSSTQERQGGASIEENYLPEEITEPGDMVPYCIFTFNHEELIRVANKYFPEDISLGNPPFFAEPLPGVKLGARRSAFVDALGPGEKGGMGETWRFEGPDGELITVKAWFTDLASIGDALCSTMSVTYTVKVETPRGEALKEKK